MGNLLFYTSALVGGLIGTATPENNGLQSRYFVEILTLDVNTTSHKNCIRIKKIKGFSSLVSIPSGNDYHNLYYISFSEATAPKAKIKSLAVLLSTNTLYAKQDTEYIYISKAFGASNPMTFIPLTRAIDSASFEYTKIAISEVPYNVTDIEIV